MSGRKRGKWCKKNGNEGESTGKERDINLWNWTSGFKTEEGEYRNNQGEHDDPEVCFGESLPRKQKI